MQRASFELGSIDYQTDAPESMTIGDVYFQWVIFCNVIQLLLLSKVAKAESCLIGGYHDERIELTYYIETLCTTMLNRDKCETSGKYVKLCIMSVKYVKLMWKVNETVSHSETSVRLVGNM